MSADDETLSAYDAAADRYAAGFAKTKDVDQSADLDWFVLALPKGGRALDLGCGPGHWTAALQGAGLRVDASDASAAMAALALERYGIEVRVEPFEALDAKHKYDGIWANFSLLHAPRAEFPDLLARVHNALKPGGALLLGMKLGKGEGRDQLGRFYAYYSEDELISLLADAGLSVKETKRGDGEGLAGIVETFVILHAHA